MREILSILAAGAGLLLFLIIMDLLVSAKARRDGTQLESRLRRIDPMVIRRIEHHSSLFDQDE